MLLPVQGQPSFGATRDFDSQWHSRKVCVALMRRYVGVHVYQLRRRIYREKPAVKPAMDIPSRQQTTVLKMLPDFGVAIQVCSFKSTVVVASGESTNPCVLLEHSLCILSKSDVRMSFPVLVVEFEIRHRGFLRQMP